MKKKNKTDERQSNPIDWNELHSRNENVRKLLEQKWMPLPEEKKKILKERASILAKEQEGVKYSGKSVDLLEFSLAQEKYGIELSYLREVYPLKELTQLPCTPPFVIGIINIRGQILSVIDLKKFFDLPEKGLMELNKVMVVYNSNIEFGVLADAVLDVRSIFIDEIQPPLHTLTGIQSKYLRGVTKDSLIILDMGNIISDKNIIVHDVLS